VPKLRLTRLLRQNVLSVSGPARLLEPKEGGTGPKPPSWHTLEHSSGEPIPGHGEKLQYKWEVAIAALLAEPSIEKAALTANVKPRTLRSWLTRPDFQTAFRQARQQLLQQTTDCLLALTRTAAETLQRNMACGHPASEIRAADLVLTHAAKGVELLDLARRVEELEQLARQRGERGPG